MNTELLGDAGYELRRSRCARGGLDVADQAQTAANSLGELRLSDAARSSKFGEVDQQRTMHATARHACIMRHAWSAAVGTLWTGIRVQTVP